MKIKTKAKRIRKLYLDGQAHLHEMSQKYFYYVDAKTDIIPNSLVYVHALE